MSKLIKIAMVAQLVLANCTAFAQIDNNIGPVVACAAEAYDVIIYNKGIDPIAAGTEIHWSVPFARAKGIYTLASAQQPGQGVVVTGALGSSYLEPGRLCEASIG